MTDREHLIALQDIDTSIDQLRIRLDKLPERAAVKEAQDSVDSLRRRRAEAESAMSAAEATLAETESHSAEIDAHRHRLEAQMKTIISPREAEALQKEIGTLNDRRSELDDRGLEMLEAISAAQDEVASVDAAEPDALQTVVDAQAMLDVAAADLSAQIEQLAADREKAVADTAESLVKQYESMRGHHSGPAVARLVGLQCTGCHIELSRAEAEIVRHVPDDQLPDCPSCGRILLP